MAEPLFLRRPSGLTVGEIASLTEAQPPGSAQLTHRITNVAPLDLAGSADLAFIEKVDYADDLASTKAGACLMTERFESRAPGHVIALRVSEPYKAFIAVARELFADALRPCSLFEAEGVAAGAFIHSSAHLDSGVIVIRER